MLPEGKQRKKNDIEYFVFEIDFMVKLLRACVWMPWRKEAMKDVVSCDKPGKTLTVCDPGISEWGNPTGVNTGYVHLNS